jgi:L-rhamnose mutarotase
MIMDTIPDFDHDKAMQELNNQPRQAEWQAYVSKFQNTSAEATAEEKWQAMDRIYKID